jgi:hypothetical protein
MNDSSLPRNLCVTKPANKFLAMKWFKRTAQGFSPGKGPASEWLCRGGRPKGSFRTRYCVDPGAEDLIDGILMSWLAEATRYAVKVQNAVGRPFRAGLAAGGHPGLKPWAVLLDHFAVKNR